METHYQTLEDAPSDSESSWQPVQEEQSRQERIKQRLAMTLRSFGHGPPMDIDDLLERLASQLERFKHYVLSLWSMIYDTFLWARLPAQRESLQQGFLALRKWLGDTLICLALVAAAWYAWAFFASCLRHELAASAPAAEVWSLSYPQGGGIPAEQPFQLHVGSFVAISPQLLATAGVSCSVVPVLPVGLALNISTCAIQGVPEQQTAGLEAFIVTAANSKTAVSVQVQLAVAAGKIYTVAGSREGGNTQSAALPGVQQKLRRPSSLCPHRGKLYIGQDGSIAEMDLQTGKVKLLFGTPSPRGNEGNGEKKEYARAGEAGGAVVYKCYKDEVKDERVSDPLLLRGYDVVSRVVRTSIPCTPASQGDREQKEYTKLGLVTGLVVYKEELYFADHSHNVVWKVGLPGSEAPGLVSRVAGTGHPGYSGDGGLATSAELDSPWGLAVVGGKLLIADWNHCIRAVDLEAGSDGIISTVAGTPKSAGFAGDGGPASQAKLSLPSALLVLGQVAYVADAGNSRIRSIDFDQRPPKIDTFAGGGAETADGAPALERQLSDPTGLSLGSDGKMYVTCCGNSDTAVDTWPIGLALDGNIYAMDCDKGYTVIAIDLQKPQFPTHLIAGTAGLQGEGTDFIAATLSALDTPAAVAAPEELEGTIFIADKHRIRRMAVGESTAVEAVRAQTADLMEQVPFLGTWSTLNADGALASPFGLPAGKTYISPELPLASEDFHFSLAFAGSDFPPSVLGVADMASIKALAANLQPGGRLSSDDFTGVGIMLAPVEQYERLAVVPFAPGMVPSQAAQASTDVMRLFARTSISLAGAVSRELLDDGSCKYALRDVTLDGLSASPPSFDFMTTPPVGRDVGMHVFAAAWGSAGQLRIMMGTPPLLERSS